MSSSLSASRQPVTRWPLTSRAGQRVQHRLDEIRALRGQAAAQHPGPAERIRPERYRRLWPVEPGKTEVTRL